MKNKIFLNNTLNRIYIIDKYFILIIFFEIKINFILLLSKYIKMKYMDKFFLIFMISKKKFYFLN